MRCSQSRPLWIEIAFLAALFVWAFVELVKQIG
jgi:hypothetical protein